MYANYVVNGTFQVGRDYSRLRVTRSNPFNRVSIAVGKRQPGEGGNRRRRDAIRKITPERDVRAIDEGTMGETDEPM